MCDGLSNYRGEPNELPRFPGLQDNNTRAKVCCLIKALDFEFLMNFITMYRVLAIM